MPWPMSSSILAAMLYAGCSLLDRVPSADAHAYLMQPVSRVLFYTPAFQAPGFPDMEYCPHCYQSRGPANVRKRAEDHTDPTELALYGDGRWPHFSAYQRGELARNGNYYEVDAIAVRHGICGDPEQTAAEGTNTYGQENSMYPVLQTYEEGSNIEMKVVMSTYHWGHLEFFICNAEDLHDGPDGVVTQGCFNMHPLDRAPDDGDASPIDPSHKGRYYVDPPCVAAERDQTMVPGAFPGDVVTARYQLPKGLTCRRCIVQMVYYTGNSCKHPGYEEFNPPSWPSKCAPEKADWITVDPATCGDGDAYPEEFWNCADIAIKSGKASYPSSPALGPDAKSEPRPSPVVEIDPFEPMQGSSPAPTPELVAEPTAKPQEPVYGSYGSAPDSGVFFNQPGPIKVSTLAPATFAPSVSSLPAPECSDPVTAFGQCGGVDYDGPRCCRQGYECVAIADCFSECRPIPDRCSEGWGQCGGRQWEGPRCCWEGAECIERNEWYSQCIPMAN